MNKIVNAIIQARMGSTRLPGKVLMDIEGIPILGHIINRLRAVDEINSIIVATSCELQDDPIVDWCKFMRVSCVRGSEMNVLDRFRQVLQHYPADAFIRATGDNPMIDVQLIRDMLAFFNNEDLSYTCYKNYPIGSGVEVFTKQALEEAIQNADQPFELEHVTPYMYQRMPERKVEYFVSSINDSKIRMTIDTEEDLLFARSMFSRLYKDNPLFGIKDIKKILLQEQSLGYINNNIHQKTLGE